METLLPAKPWTRFASAAAFAAFGAALLLYPAQVRDSVAASLIYCMASLVPSLFPFMVLSSFGVRSGAGEALGRVLAPVTRRLFRLPQVCGATVILSFVGGYPAGARGVSLLLEEGKITREQAGRMMTFCVAPGAAFVVTFLGCGVLGNLAVGWLMFLSVTLSGLALGILSGLGKPLPPKVPSGVREPAGGALVRSVADASSATVKMCGCILLFAGAMAILQGSGAFATLANLAASTGLVDRNTAMVCLSFLWEVTGGTGDAARLGASPTLYAFGLAFGGLCVHVQAASFFPELPLAPWKFFLFRLAHGLLSAGLFRLLAPLLPLSTQVVWAASSQTVTYKLSASTVPGGLSLLLMCAAFLVFVGKGLSRREPSPPSCAQKHPVV